MKMETSMQKAFGEQFNKELYSAYLYLAMSAECENLDLPGFGAWLRTQSDEELKHAMKFYTHLIDRGNEVAFAPIAKPDKRFGAPKPMFAAALAHERFITKSIHDLAELAQKEKDPASLEFLQWFIKEQVEEEKQTAAILGKLGMADGHPGAILMLDHELGKRKSD